MKYTYNDLLKIIKDNGIKLDVSYDIEIYQDDCNESPREWSNIGIIYAPNSRYLKNEWTDTVKPSEDKYYIYPVSTLDHSGVSVFLGTPTDPWDSWCDARICIPKSETTDSHKAYEIEKDEIKILNAWMNGWVYGYAITDSTGEYVDGCGGFYELDDMKEYIDFDKYNITQEDFEKAKENIKYV